MNKSEDPYAHILSAKSLVWIIDCGKTSTYLSQLITIYGVLRRRIMDSRAPPLITIILTNTDLNIGTSSVENPNTRILTSALEGSSGLLRSIGLQGMLAIAQLLPPHKILTLVDEDPINSSIKLEEHIFQGCDYDVLKSGLGTVSYKEAIAVSKATGLGNIDIKMNQQ